VVWGHPDRDHIFFNEFPEVNASIETAGNDIHTTVAGSRILQELRVIPGELP
jgi:hypothetical protein